jgi:hypothetical protein
LLLLHGYSEILLWLSEGPRLVCKRYEFKTPTATSPNALGQNQDTRQLGIRVHTLIIRWRMLEKPLAMAPPETRLPSIRSTRNHPQSQEMT